MREHAPLPRQLDAQKRTPGIFCEIYYNNKTNGTGESSTIFLLLVTRLTMQHPEVLQCVKNRLYGGGNARGSERTQHAPEYLTLF